MNSLWIPAPRLRGDKLRGNDGRGPSGKRRADYHPRFRGNGGWWTSLPANPNRGGVLVHGGDRCFDFKGVRVLPWFIGG